MNIGGQLIVTSELTLRVVPNSLFGLMFAEGCPLRPSNRMFRFDRDPSHFHIILMYLYSQNTNLLLPKPKSSFRHLKQGIQEFHRKYVLVPADKPANNIVVVCRLYYINTLKQELNGTKAYEETSKDEKSVVYSHLNEIPKKFAVDVKERQDRLPTMYWLPKLHKRPYKARFIANSSSCTTTELSKLLTSCLTAVKAKVIKYCETVYERSVKNMFWPIKNYGEILS